MEYFIIAVVSFVVGWKLSQTWHLFTFRSILEDLNVSNTDLKRLAEQKGIEIDTKENNTESDLPILEVRVEKTDLGLFAYRKDNSLYLARGQDREELMANLVNNLTNVRVVVAKEDGAELISP